MRDGAAGFSLIELLVVMTVIAVLAAIVIPRYQDARAEAFLTTVRSDLRILTNQQAAYQSDHQVYADDPAEITDLVPSEGVHLSINEVNQGEGWAATAYHEALSGRTCGIFYGNGSASNAAPATSPGVVACDD